MPVPDSIAELVQKYTANRTQYRQQSYKEAQMRIDFINPLFEALGWDMDNKAGLPEAYRQVVYEDALKVERTVKAPDYSFRLGGKRKFFVETKKPTVNIKVSPQSAYQLRRYASTVKLPVSILTSFEEMAVYDGLPVPDQKDPASKARLDFYNYKEYADRWDELYGRFSYEAVQGGAFDRYAQEAVVLFRGYQTVDKAFLATIEGWRSSLAQALTLRNPSLTLRELNRAVQTLIDRVLFLRICEARGMETQYPLQPIANGANVFPRLKELFQHADARYNSGLFNVKADTLPPHLLVDDRPLKELIASLYFPQSPFEFSEMPPDVLGQVYEQFLGKVIRVEGGTAVVEEKPEVRKAGGVFYTPTYIVEYIVRQTVGRLVEGKTPKQVAGVTVLDPACGSGSFLIGAYQFLLDWHRDWYVADGPEKYTKGKSAVLFAGPKNTWRLTTSERKRILRGFIYGVDIDTQAVEVTKLSLLLKMLEGESAEIIDRNLSLFHERALPDLEANIKCGNSLIGTDFYADQDMTLFDTETKLRINVFDWDTEFAAIMGKGGFSAVIGNPPYIFGEYHDANTKLHLHTTYQLANNQYDTYWLFIEKGLSLVARGGRFSLIVPDALLARDEAQGLRKLLLDNGLSRIYHCGLVFLAAVSTVVFCVEKAHPASGVECDKREGTLAVHERACPVTWFRSDPKTRFLVHTTDAEAEVLLKAIRNSKTLEETQWATLSRGEETGKKSVHTLSGDLNSVDFPILVGEDISRYQMRKPTRHVTAITKNAALYEAPKVVIVKTGNRCIATLDETGYVTMQSVYNLHLTTQEVAPAALLAILNSRFVDFYIDRTCTAYKLLFPQLNQSTIMSVPIPLAILGEQHDQRAARPASSTTSEQHDQRAARPASSTTSEQHDQIVSLVEQMLFLQRQLPAQTDPQERNLTTRTIAATDKRIDNLVYALYGLSQGEIDLVEGRTAPASDAPMV